jgi:hypothetical protein
MPVSSPSTSEVISDVAADHGNGEYDPTDKQGSILGRTLPFSE